MGGGAKNANVFIHFQTKKVRAILFRTFISLTIFSHQIIAFCDEVCDKNFKFDIKIETRFFSVLHYTLTVVYVFFLILMCCKIAKNFCHLSVRFFSIDQYISLK